MAEAQTKTTKAAKPSSATARTGLLQRKCDCGNHTIAGSECGQCKKGTMQRSPAMDSGRMEVPPIVHAVLSSPGRPLDAGTRAFFEPRFARNFASVPVSSVSRQVSQSSLTVGEPDSNFENEADRMADSVVRDANHSERPLAGNERQRRFDLSGVRVHTDARAAESAAAVNARAYTVGNDIVFGAGQFKPGTSEGRRLIAHELTHTFQQGGAGLGPVRRTLLQRDVRIPEESMEGERRVRLTSATGSKPKRRFVREEGLNLREGPDQKTPSLGKLKFGTRVHVIDESVPGWLKVAVLGKTGYVHEPKIHSPKDPVLQEDPGLRLIRVKPNQTFWGLVKEVYGIQGNESTKDQNINHFINAIRAVNNPEAFKIKTDTWDDIGNFFLAGRDASDTYLRENYDLWIPGFNLAAKMDVGSGTIRGEAARLVKKIEQKIADFKEACRIAGNFIPKAIQKHVGEMAEGLLQGLIDFAMEAAAILAISTAVGALIGALFGGVGAIPGAEIGFEIGLIILEYYGLYMLIEAILGVAGGLMSALGGFISQVWTANGDKKKLTQAGQSLADALGIMLGAILAVVAALILKKGANAIKKTKFGKKVGESRLSKWIEDRQNKKTTNTVAEQKAKQGEGPVKEAAKVKEKFEEFSAACELGSIRCRLKLPAQVVNEAGKYPAPKGFTVPMPPGPFTVLKSRLTGVSRSTQELREIAIKNRKKWPAFDKALAQAEAKGQSWVYDASGKAWEVHHIKPVAFGGGNTLDNLVPLPRTVHLEFSAWWSKVHRAFSSRFTAAEWDLIYTDAKVVAGSSVPKGRVR
jgi:hypothetical protein